MYKGRAPSRDEGGRLVIPLGWQSPGSTPPTVPVLQGLAHHQIQELTLFHWIACWSGVVFLHVKVMVTDIPHLPVNLCLLTLWPTLNVGLQHSGSSETLHHLYLLGFSKVPWSLWGHDGKMGAEGRLSVHIELKTYSRVGTAGGRSPECAHSSDFSPCLCSV